MFLYTNSVQCDETRYFLSRTQSRISDIFCVGSSLLAQTHGWGAGGEIQPQVGGRLDRRGLCIQGTAHQYGSSVQGYLHIPERPFSKLNQINLQFFTKFIAKQWSHASWK